MKQKAKDCDLSLMLKFLRYIFIPFLLATSVLYSQPLDANINLDSLKNLPLTERLDKLLKYGWLLRSQNPELAISINKEAIRIAKKLRKNSKIAEAYNYLGVCYRNISEYDSSFFYYKKALRYASIESDSIQIAYSYNNIGGYFGYKGQYFLALENIFNAINIFKKLGDLRGLAFSKLQVGLAYRRLHNFNSAIKYYKDVIEIRKKIGDDFGIAVAKLLLSETYIVMKKYTDAETLLNSCYPKFKAKNDIKGLASILGYLGDIKYYRGDYFTSLNLHRKALAITRKIKDFIGIINNENGLAKNYFKMNKIDSALVHLNIAAKMAKEKAYLTGYINSLNTYCEIYSQLNDPDKLAYYSHKLIAVKDSVYRRETELKNEEFGKLIALYELERKNSILKSDIQNKKMIIVFSVGFGIIFFAFLLIILYQNKKIRERSRELKKALEDKNKLFSIVAHDLKNPFNAMLGYADLLLAELEGDYDVKDLSGGIEQMRASAQKLLDMVENLLQWARSQTGKIRFNPDKYSIKEILRETSSYFTQSALTKGVKLSVDDEADYSCYCDRDMINAVLRNLLSNAIKFSSNGDEVKVYTEKSKDGKFIVIYVEDTGAGMSEETLESLFTETVKSSRGTFGEKGTGLGLILVKEMVEKNNGEVHIHSKLGEGTKIWFTLPLAS